MAEEVERIRVKRIYRAGRNSDGKRVLVDRLWPRGMTKFRARLDEWAKEIAPSDELRQWLHADPERWESFRQKYFAELDQKEEAIERLIEWARNDTVTLLYSSSDNERNNAVALRDYLMAKMSG